MNDNKNILGEFEPEDPWKIAFYVIFTAILIAVVWSTFS